VAVAVAGAEAQAATKKRRTTSEGYFFDCGASINKFSH